jgi:hypothetical protein
VGGALAGAPAGAATRLAAVRVWWRERHPPPSLGSRLDRAYTVALVTAIFGALVYGTASSALARVITPAGVATIGPALALAALLVTAQWGAFQGPVIFSVADVTHLLGAPLPRRGLAVRPLVRALGLGAAAAAIVAGVVLVGLAGGGRTIAAGAGAGLVAGGAALGVIGVAAAWAVERSARVERLARRSTWPVIALAAGLAAGAHAASAVRTAALWSGPWGWAVQPGAGAAAPLWEAALALLAAVTAAAAARAYATRGDCPAERHLRRAEARASATASLVAFDARTARLALSGAGARTRAPRAGGPPRRLGAARPILWRDAAAALSAPGRVAEALLLYGAAVVLALADAAPAATAVAALLAYAAAARMLWPLRTELDVPERTRVLLRARPGRVLLDHTLVPALLLAVAGAVAAAGCALAGSLPADGAPAAVTAAAAAPLVTLCAALSARRGGRIPPSVFATATAIDPSGGAGALLAWLALWPGAAVALVGIAAGLVAAGGATAWLATAWIALAVSVLALPAGADPDRG